MNFLRWLHVKATDRDITAKPGNENLSSALHKLKFIGKVVDLIGKKYEERRNKKGKFLAKMFVRYDRKLWMINVACCLSLDPKITIDFFEWDDFWVDGFFDTFYKRRSFNTNSNNKKIYFGYMMDEDRYIFVRLCQQTMCTTVFGSQLGKVIRRKCSLNLPL